MTPTSSGTSSLAVTNVASPVTVVSTQPTSLSNLPLDIFEKVLEFLSDDRLPPNEARATDFVAPYSESNNPQEDSKLELQHSRSPLYNEWAKKIYDNILFINSLDNVRFVCKDWGRATHQIVAKRFEEIQTAIQELDVLHVIVQHFKNGGYSSSADRRYFSKNNMDYLSRLIIKSAANAWKVESQRPKITKIFTYEHNPNPHVNPKNEILNSIFTQICYSIQLEWFTFLNHIGLLKVYFKEEVLTPDSSIFLFCKSYIEERGSVKDPNECKAILVFLFRNGASLSWELSKITDLIEVYSLRAIRLEKLITLIECLLELSNESDLLKPIDKRLLISGMLTKTQKGFEKANEECKRLLQPLIGRLKDATPPTPRAPILEELDAQKVEPISRPPAEASSPPQAPRTGIVRILINHISNFCVTYWNTIKASNLSSGAIRLTSLNRKQYVQLAVATLASIGFACYYNQSIKNSFSLSFKRITPLFFGSGQGSIHLGQDLSQLSYY